MPARVDIPRNLLIDLYLNKRLSSRKIAKILGYAYSTIDSKIKRAGLPIRNLAEAHIIYPRSNFSGNLIEKAYLIGFRIGDLRVRKFYKNSQTILVDCASTKDDQINLIKQLFAKYGRVWVSKPTSSNKRHIQCHLDISFNFMLEKKAPPWIFRDISYFFSFLAGFTDAEGSMFISANQAKFSLGNYNITLLRKIRLYLKRLNITSQQITCSHRKGLIASHGYRYNHDYWTLVVSRKKDLYHLLISISPYLKHLDKVNRLHLALKNIHDRNNLYGTK